MNTVGLVLSCVSILVTVEDQQRLTESASPTQLQIQFDSAESVKDLSTIFTMGRRKLINEHGKVDAIAIQYLSLI